MQNQIVILANEPAAPAPPAPVAPAPAHGVWRAVVFDGNAREYFGIWLSNLLLTVLTLGVYGAWAKARRINYFYNHTRINNMPLVYHATGLQIFKGRLIVYLAFAAGGLLETFITWSSLALFAAFTLVSPWLINKSLAFTARNTSWRNVRLRWRGSYGASFLYFTLLPFVGIVFFFLFPLMTRRAHAYYIRRHSFGQTAFAGMPKTWRYYVAALAAALTFVLALIPLGPVTDSYNAGDGQPLPAGIIPLFFVAGAGALVVYTAMCRNAAFAVLRLGDVVAFSSAVSPPRMLWIQATNLLAILLSFGLLLPWAATRRYAYLCAATSCRFSQPDDAFADEELQKVSSLGDEAADLEGMDVGFV